MQELNFINTWLGGHTITLAGFKVLAGTKKQITVCEIGCGGGDNLIAIQRWCKKKNIMLYTIGIDINPFCIDLAAEQLPKENTQLITADYQTVQFEKKPDIIFSSLFCHHFTNEQLVQQLRWMNSHSGTGFFINDLHRHPLAYHSIKWLTRAFSKSYLVKNDAPLSVQRGFQKKEWLQLLDSAEIAIFSVLWKWAFRWLIIAKSK